MTKPSHAYTTLLCGNPTCRATVVMPTRLANALTRGDTAPSVGRIARTKLAGVGWRMTTEIGDEHPTPHCRRCSV